MSKKVQALPRPATDGERMAARFYALANPSDPFAFGRMLTHCRLGIEDATAVAALWRSRALKQKAPSYGEQAQPVERAA